ncbi:MAG: histidine phosphatase family protein [Nocardioides sp.]|nr:histidine phosphatase family protein [Nocardioides sp.]
MSELWIVRHGPTEWSLSHRHTSHTDLPLVPEHEDDARSLAPRLADVDFAQVITSPRQRARRTAELAGFPDAEVCDDLVEWDYGDYEGRTTEDIRTEVPDWTVWTHPVPGGESAGDVSARLDRVVARAEQAGGPVLAFAHGHSLRALAARWLELPVSEGRRLRLDTATLSVLGWERGTRVVLRWNS